MIHIYNRTAKKLRNKWASAFRGALSTRVTKTSIERARAAVERKDWSEAVLLWREIARAEGSYKTENRPLEEKLARKAKKDSEAAEDLYWYSNADFDDASANFHPAVIRKAVEFGYTRWPITIRNYIRGRTVLDVGCGSGMHGIGFVIVGARSYFGVDPKISIDGDIIKNRNKRKQEPFGVTGRQLMELYPRVHLISGTLEELPVSKKFELISLHTVTEHLMNIESVFSECAERLANNGQFIFYHHNFFSWNGHHQAPKSVDAIDPNDPEQAKFMDWEHLSYEAPPDHSVSLKLNKIRLDEIKELTSSYFDIVRWEEIEDEHVRSRLTKTILDKHPEFSKREMLVNKVLCVARKKSR